MTLIRKIVFSATIERARHRCSGRSRGREGGAETGESAVFRARAGGDLADAIAHRGKRWTSRRARITCGCRATA